MPLSISRSLNKNVYESLDHSSGLFGRNLDESLTPEGEERHAAEMKKQAAEAAAQKSQQEYDNAFPLRQWPAGARAGRTAGDSEHWEVRCRRGRLWSHRERRLGVQSQWQAEGRRRVG